MAREFSRKFYKSKSWENARNGVVSRAHGLCEICYREGRIRPGEIVHHKEHLTPSNINNPEISLNGDNLEFVCRDCHARCHPEIYGTEDFLARVAFDDYGNVVRIDND